MANLTITTIQSRLHWEDKQANLSMFEEKIRGIKENTELVILPEMFSTGFSMNPGRLAETMEGETLHWMKRVAAENRVILTGSFICAETSLATQSGLTGFSATSSGLTGFTNRLVWMLPNGEYGIYDKRHLFAYAGEDRHYTAGSKRLIASVKGWAINLQICYDLRFPVWARQTPPPPGKTGIKPEYDVLVYVANWPERRRLAWMTLLQARAIENQCYVIGVNRVGEDGNGIYHSGDSMIIDPAGEILYTKKDAEDIFTITLERSLLDSTREKLPFLEDADRFRILENE